ncbi:MAG: hypothetical protein IJD97_09560 [Clostridia bacterium]|nr:hypothetical protein [Clostridia bacterium]
MKVSEIAEKLELSYGSGKESPDKDAEGCYIGDLLSLAMAKVDVGNVWITIQTNINVVAVASLKEAACVIVVDGFEIDEAVKAKADAEEVIILETPLSAYETAIRLMSLGI